jgi:hypothetical protein
MLNNIKMDFRVMGFVGCDEIELIRDHVQKPIIQHFLNQMSREEISKRKVSSHFFMCIIIQDLILVLNIFLLLHYCLTTSEICALS